MKKKFLKMILFVVIALFNMIFIGCGNDKQNEEKNVSTAQIELKFLHKWPQEENSAYFKEVVAEFEKENPNIKIVMEGVGEEPIKDKLRILMGTDEQPDVFFLGVGNLQKNLFVQKML